MQRHAGDSELRRELVRLRTRALRFPGYAAGAVRKGAVVAWRVTIGEVDRHELNVHVRPAEEVDGILQELFDSLPIGYGVLAVEKTLEGRLIRIRLGRVRHTCYQCGEAMDEAAKWALSESCSGCGLAAGEITLTVGSA